MLVLLIAGHLQSDKRHFREQGRVHKSNSLYLEGLSRIVSTGFMFMVKQGRAHIQPHDYTERCSQSREKCKCHLLLVSRASAESERKSKIRNNHGT